MDDVLSAVKIQELTTALPCVWLPRWHRVPLGDLGLTRSRHGASQCDTLIVPVPPAGLYSSLGPLWGIGAWHQVSTGAPPLHDMTTPYSTKLQSPSTCPSKPDSHLVCLTTTKSYSRSLASCPNRSHDECDVLRICSLNGKTYASAGLCACTVSIRIVLYVLSLIHI